MNQTFSFARWGLLVKKHWAENYKRYLLSLLAMGGLLVAWYSFILIMDKVDPLGIFFQYSAYYVGLYFTGCLYASMFFSELGSKTTGISYLSLPASPLEKLLCAVFFGVFLFFIAYTLVFYLVDIPMVELSNRLIRLHPRVWPGTDQFVPALAVYNVFTPKASAIIGEAEYHFLLLGFFAIQSCFLLGSVYFPRYSFIKTIVLVLLFTLILTIFFKEAIFDTMPDGWQNNILAWDRYNEHWTHLQKVRLPWWLDQTATLLLQYSVPPVFWIITYYRLKEKEL
ncbi:MAG TPA: hypothetical protein VG052_14090 [Puia sp.]|jgi:hypothetical protein|nr:hypothetical protein [Puia sp.]